MSQHLHITSMQFSVKTEYALRAIYEISQNKSEEPIRRKVIATNQDIPIHFLEHILISLKKGGIIQSIRGMKGGYTLAKPAAEINLWDLYKSVEEVQEENQCFPAYKTSCERFSHCKIKSVWTNLNQTVKEHMRSLTLDSVLTGV